MGYTVNYRWGASIDSDRVTEEDLDRLLLDLDENDHEHPDVSVYDNQANVTLSVFAGDRGLVVLEDEDEAPYHRVGVTRDDARRLLVAFVHGEDLRTDDQWLPGYG